MNNPEQLNARIAELAAFLDPVAFQRADDRSLQKTPRVRLAKSGQPLRPSRQELALIWNKPTPVRLLPKRPH
jgi:hypothetical protein